MFGKKPASAIDPLIKAMERSMRVNGAATRDTLLRDEIRELSEKLTVVLNKSNSIPTEKLDPLRAQVRELSLKISLLRVEEGF